MEKMCTNRCFCDGHVGLDGLGHRGSVLGGSGAKDVEETWQEVSCETGKRLDICLRLPDGIVALLRVAVRYVLVVLNQKV